MGPTFAAIKLPVIPLRQTRLGIPKDPLRGFQFLFQGRQGKFNNLVDSILGATSMAGDNTVAVFNRVALQQRGVDVAGCRAVEVGSDRHDHLGLE